MARTPDEPLEPLDTLSTADFIEWPPEILAARAAKGLPVRCPTGQRCRSLVGRCGLCGAE